MGELGRGKREEEESVVVVVGEAGAFFFLPVVHIPPVRCILWEGVP